jgi:hypothetical protein
MRRITGMLMLAGLVCLVPVASADEKEKAPENPFLKAKVGEWVSYKMAMPAPLNQEIAIKQIVAKKTDDSVTIKVDMDFMGMKQSQEQKISLKDPYDPVKAMQQQGVKGDIKKGKTGEEKIKIGTKEYSCRWEESEVTAEVMGQKIASKIKVWTSKDVPLGGMVKMETEVMGIKMTMEMTGSGVEK